MKLIKITVLRQKSDLVFKFFTVLHYDINVSLRSTSCVYLSNVALAVLHFSSALLHSDTNPLHLQALPRIVQLRHCGETGARLVSCVPNLQ